MGYTALQIACANVALESVKLLLDAGADAKSRNENGVDALDALIISATAGNDAEECAKLLVRWPYAVSAHQVDEKGQTRLHRIHTDTPVGIVQTLVEFGALFDEQDRDGYMPLAIAIARGNAGVAEYLFKRGANLNVYGPKFGSILHLAVKHGMLSLVKLMIAAGADVERSTLSMASHWSTRP